MATQPDPAELAIANALFASVADEMGVTLGRTAHSPNIKERRDYSCAVFDPRARLVAQAAHIPVHLGAMPTAVEAAMQVFAHPEESSRVSRGKTARRLEGFKPGDVVILNDPYLGGTHLPDITMVSPVFLEPATTARSAHPEEPGSASLRRAAGRLEGRAAARRLELIGFVASRAHHADVGGISPGSMPIAEELIQEGVVIPPIKLYDRGRLNRAVLNLLLRNMRAPDERRADLDAQIAAQRTGEARLREIVERYGLRRAQTLMRALMDYAERMTRSAIAAIPDGTYTFEDALDDDGAPSNVILRNEESGVVGPTSGTSTTSRPAHPEVSKGERRHDMPPSSFPPPSSSDSIPIRVTITISGDTLHADFTGSAPERPSSINAVAAVTRSAVYYVVRCLLDENVPSNDGCFRPVILTLPERSVVNAGPPRAVAAGNVETSQRIVDVVLGALAEALPDRIPAASQGTMNNITIGGNWAGQTSLTAHPEEPGVLPGRTEGVSKGERRIGAPDRQFAYYETIAGGAGASPTFPGLAAAHTHMTNTLNTPVEALEMAYPFRVTEYSIRRGSGGPGRNPGGDGITRTYEFLAPATVTLITERRLLAPYGLAGGEFASPGHNTLLRLTSGLLPPTKLPSKVRLTVAPGDRLTIETPGGGGWGLPR